jgi:hypothetical protein
MPTLCFLFFLFASSPGSFFAQRKKHRSPEALMDKHLRQHPVSSHVTKRKGPKEPARCHMPDTPLSYTTPAAPNERPARTQWQQRVTPPPALGVLCVHNVVSKEEGPHRPACLHRQTRCHCPYVSRLNSPCRVLSLSSRNLTNKYPADWLRLSLALQLDPGQQPCPRSRN